MYRLLHWELRIVNTYFNIFISNFHLLSLSDYDKVITHYIQQYKYEDALDILTDQAAIALKHPEKVGNHMTVTW